MSVAIEQENAGSPGIGLLRQTPISIDFLVSRLMRFGPLPLACTSALREAIATSVLRFKSGQPLLTEGAPVEGLYLFAQGSRAAMPI